MTLMENKEYICHILSIVLWNIQKTKKLKTLRYDEQTDMVVAIFNGSENQNIDIKDCSCAEMVKQIVNQLLE